MGLQPKPTRLDPVDPIPAQWLRHVQFGGEVRADLADPIIMQTASQTFLSFILLFPPPGSVSAFLVLKIIFITPAD